nr:immunoglobulin heavy chain junction region [Mus musculus]
CARDYYGSSFDYW